MNTEPGFFQYSFIILINMYTPLRLLFISLLILSCDDRVEEPNQTNVIVTMLRVDRIEILDKRHQELAPIECTTFR